MEVVKKEVSKAVFTVKLDEDEVGYIAVALGGVTRSFYDDNRDYIDKTAPPHTNEMSSGLYRKFKELFEDA